MQLSNRSTEKEYLDNDVIETKALYRNLLELDIINKRLGGYNASRNGLATILKTRKNIESVLDIGFGGGDSIKQLSKFADRNKRYMFFYGVDLKSDCVKYAEENLTLCTNKKLICDDYRNIPSDLLKETDIIHCSLFLHHLTDKEIIDLFKFAKANKCIVLANDLHRHWLAYYSIKFLTALFSRSYLVKNDAPISVKRGFKKKELIALLKKAGIDNYSVKWSWAFRYIVIANA
ncbi:MAG TPA: methyltransferase domain-containing protein [Bacteroidia bacterium]|jgi:2-polyprenyl-3-methyl-5-hydroxy-6-metoxy-1,4-benzoquinol methylase|nr:methyltransferase domain-containing protein [Bacteroidia bacterium]